jgi:hypothetical protein
MPEIRSRLTICTAAAGMAHGKRHPCYSVHYPRRARARVSRLPWSTPSGPAFAGFASTLGLTIIIVIQLPELPELPEPE